MAHPTPEPWVLVNDEYGLRIESEDDGFRIATIRDEMVTGTGFEEAEANGFLLLATPRLAASLRATVRQLDAVKVCINDPECRAMTERKIEEARAVLRAAGVDTDANA